ncbi:MAG: hypothetical protein RL358_1232 [Pseudomonadota bacterium]|jgi:diguanylate cyclase (GGDEF)-like protein/PAS domain S-box-containing protein
MPTTVYKSRTWLLLAVLLTALWVDAAHAAEPIRIGVLSFRPERQTLSQWQPLAVALKHAMPQRDFVIKAFNYPALEAAVRTRQVDFVLTNPAHYVLLTKQIGLSAPLATLANNENGESATAFGGVIFTLANNAQINALADLKHKKIAATSTESFGGYQMQAFELSRIGISLARDATVITTDMPHDKVVQAVLEGRAEVGLVRTGVLEGLAREGRFDMRKIKIINAQNLPNYPAQLSTRLYPEWTFAALPHIDEKLTRLVVAAILSMEENVPAMRAIGIHGFVVPADYSPVIDLLKELRLPPFEAMPVFTPHDIWVRYFWLLMLALGALSLILLLGLRLLYTIRQLKAKHRIVQTQKQQLQESEAYLNAIIANEPECIQILDAKGRLLEMNPAGLAMIEANSLAQVLGHSWQEIILPPYRLAFARLLKRVLAGENVQMEFEVRGLKGGHRWLETHAVTMQQKQLSVVLAVTRDITERKKSDAQIRQLAFYDTLTKLPNRRMLHDRLVRTLAASKRSACYSALMFLDLDNFKPLNDTYGHGVGDLLLIEAAARLGNCVREVDTVARFGGDEFVVMLSELSPDQADSTLSAQRVAEKILAALSMPYVLPVSRDGQPTVDIEHRCTASIGVAMFIDADTQPEGILESADAAMYQAKESGRNAIFFT